MKISIEHLAALVMALSTATSNAQLPASGLRQGSGVDSGAPPSSLRGAPAQPAAVQSSTLPGWTPRAPTSRATTTPSPLPSRSAITPSAAGAAKRVPLTSSTAALAPRRTSPQRAFQQLRADQDRVGMQAVDAPSQRAVRAASTSAFPATSAALREAVGSKPNVMGDPGIVSVNGRIRDIRLMPGSRLVIAGQAFGDAPGSARLVGGALDGNPVPVLVSKWQSDRIEAAIPGNTRGVPDVANARIEVRGANGTPYRFDGISFVAARAETTLTDAARIAEYLYVEANPSWHASIAGNAVARAAEGKSIDCPRAGRDTLRFRALNGFEVVGLAMTFGRSDTGDGDMAGNPGGRVFFQGYAFGDWRDENVTRPNPTPNREALILTSALPVSWGVFRSHTSPGFDVFVGFAMDPLSMPLETALFTAIYNLGTIPGTGVPVPFAVPAPPAIHDKGPWDFCFSGYVITSLTLYGPDGVKP